MRYLFDDITLRISRMTKYWLLTKRKLIAKELLKILRPGNSRTLDFALKSNPLITDGRRVNRLGVEPASGNEDQKFVDRRIQSWIVISDASAGLSDLQVSVFVGCIHLYTGCFFSAWPISACPSLPQCWFVRRVSGKFLSRWQELY